MVVVRLQRLGTKKTPHHRIVVQEKASAQVSRVLEVVGHYDPDNQKFSVKQDRVDHWVSNGAQISEALGRILKHHAKKATAGK